MGTIPYMSPEQASGRPVDSRSDIFSFGVVLYEVLAGKRPFTGSSGPEILQQVTHSMPDPLPGADSRGAPRDCGEGAGKRPGAALSVDAGASRGSSGNAPPEAGAESAWNGCAEMALVGSGRAISRVSRGIRTVAGLASTYTGAAKSAFHGEVYTAYGFQRRRDEPRHIRGWKIRRFHFGPERRSRNLVGGDEQRPAYQPVPRPDGRCARTASAIGFSSRPVGVVDRRS